MSKKLLVAAAAVVISSGAMAQSAFEGFYGQLGVGYENDSFANKSIYATGASGDGGNALSAPSQSAGNFSGAIGLGYNYSVAPNLVLGLGVDYNPLAVKSGQNALSKNVTTGSNTTTQASNRYNIFVTPGYQFGADKLGYIKLGYSAEQIKAEITNTTSNVKAGSGTSNASGYIVGLGYKQLINKNIYAFGEVNYMTYSNTSISVLSGLGVNTTPSAYQALVGVGYKF